MNVTSLRDLYIAELQEIRSVEGQLIEALPRMADVSGHPELKQGIQTHLEEEKRTDERPRTQLKPDTREQASQP
jgi:ferritin-like metal-binding protein YciE